MDILADALVVLPLTFRAQEIDAFASRDVSTAVGAHVLFRGVELLAEYEFHGLLRSHEYLRLSVDRADEGNDARGDSSVILCL